MVRSRMKPISNEADLVGKSAPYIPPDALPNVSVLFAIYLFSRN